VERCCCETVITPCESVGDTLAWGQKRCRFVAQLVIEGDEWFCFIFFDEAVCLAPVR